MAYNIKLSLSLDHEDLGLALITARAILERRLGGPLGVEAAYIAARQVLGPDTRLWEPRGCSADQVAAVGRWQRAVDAVWTQLQQDLAHLPDDTLDEMIDGEFEMWVEVVGVSLAPF